MFNGDVVVPHIVPYTVPYTAVHVCLQHTECLGHAGKTETLSAAVFMRTRVNMPEGGLVFIAAATHAAVDVLMKRIKDRWQEYLDNSCGEQTADADNLSELLLRTTDNDTQALKGMGCIKNNAITRSVEQRR